MHRFIQQLKAWLRDVHHHASEKYMQAYFDKYCYRFNKQGSRNSIIWLTRWLITHPFVINY
ncbi:hypothetical protein [Ekhidna sp.]